MAAGATLIPQFARVGANCRSLSAYGYQLSASKPDSRELIAESRSDMDARTRAAFLILVLAQAAHSVEEYVFKLYDVFAPARFVSRLVSDDLALGFGLANAAIVAFGIWCYLTRVRPGRPSARSWIWPWVVVEGANGIGHAVIAAVRGQYFPGVFTAPALLAVSLYLGARLVRVPVENDRDPKPSDSHR